MEHKIEITEGTLDLVKCVATTAYTTGALVNMEVETEIMQGEAVDEDGIAFTVFTKKHGSKDKTQPLRDITITYMNPFFDDLVTKSPLFVKRINETHNLSLSKYSVIPNHMIATTVGFVPQSASLDHNDFIVIHHILHDSDSIAFFNCGSESGATQPHKHIQFLPRETAGKYLPIDKMIVSSTSSCAGDSSTIKPLTVKVWPFKYRIESIKGKTSIEMNQICRHMMDSLYLTYDTGLVNYMTHDQHAFKSYNVIVTREYLAIIPRSKEIYKGISINALGFLGSFLVGKDSPAYKVLKDERPVGCLKQVTC